MWLAYVFNTVKFFFDQNGDLEQFVSLFFNVCTAVEWIRISVFVCGCFVTPKCKHVTMLAVDIKQNITVMSRFDFVSQGFNKMNINRY